MIFHDHGGWIGPCSVERHAFICAGPADRFLSSVVRVDDAWLCRCCRVPLAPMFTLPEPYDGCAY
jgi:hypothetical protein